MLWQGDKKKRFNEIQQTLAKLSTEFSNNLLDATKAYSIRITDKAQVPPESLSVNYMPILPTTIKETFIITKF